MISKEVTCDGGEKNKKNLHRHTDVEKNSLFFSIAHPQAELLHFWARGGGGIWNYDWIHLLNPFGTQLC